MATQLYTLKQSSIVVTWSVKSYVSCLAFTGCRYFRHGILQKLFDNIFSYKLGTFCHVFASRKMAEEFANWFLNITSYKKDII